MIRLLRADEIDVRIGGFNKDKTGGFLLLYKDARVDMNLLDETFGVRGWQRKHELINGNLFCTISIWDDDKKQWVDKQDVGVESKSAKEKGEASDAFKRAGTNVGIGRELYTPLFIWINTLAENDKFKVSEIGYNDKREIDKLTIVNDKGIQAFKLGSYTSPDKQTPTPEPKKTDNQDAKKEPKKLAPPKEDGEGRTETGEKLANEKQLKLMFFLAKERDWTSDLKFYLKSELNIDNSAELTHPQVSKIITMLQGMEKVE